MATDTKVTLEQRRTAARLIEAEYDSRIDDLTKEPGCKEVQAERAKLMKKHKAKIDRIEKLKRDLQKAEKDLAKATVPTGFKDGGGRRYGRCCSTDDWKENINNQADFNLATPQKDVDKLKRELRNLLARVQTADTQVKLANVYKAAGLA